MKAVAYVRVSTNKEEQELSLENQTEFFKKYVETRGDTLVSIYSDKGKSATKMGNRTELQKLLKAAGRGDFQKLYVKDISRLFRNTLDFITVSRQLAEHNVNLHLVNMGEGKDIDTFTLNLMAMLAENESQKMSERIRFSKKISQEKGIVPNFVYGYDRVDRFTLVPNPEESAWVQEIFRLYTEEQWGMARIAKYLYEHRVKTKKLLNGEPNYSWSQNTVGQLLRNQIYIGKVINGRQSKKNIYTDERIDNPEEKWHIAERPEFRIIPDATFNKAQSLIKINADKYRTTALGSATATAVRRSDKHLFSNIIKCNSCGYSFRRSQRKSTDGTYNAWWICSKRAAYGTARCTDEYVRINEEWLKLVMGKLLCSLVDNKEAFFKSVEANCSAVVQEYIKKTAGFDIDELETTLHDLREQRERLKTMTVRGILSMEEAERDIIPLNAEIERLTFALNQTDSTRELTNEVKSNINRFFKAFENLTFNDELDNAKLKMLVREIRVISKQELHVYFNLGDDIDTVKIPLSITYESEIDTNVPNCT